MNCDSKIYGKTILNQNVLFNYRNFSQINEVNEITQFAFFLVTFVHELAHIKRSES